MMSWLFQYGALTLLLIASAADNSGGKTVEAPAPWDDYKVVVERNIFSREPERPVERPSTAASQAPPAPSEPAGYVVLTGVVQQGEELIAFLEDIQTGTTSRARVGDAVANGRLTKITLDYVEYESDGQTARIEIGKDLGGSISAPAISYGSSEAAGGAEVPADGTSESGATVNRDEAAVLERLRQKREKELGE